MKKEDCLLWSSDTNGPSEIYQLDLTYFLDNKTKGTLLTYLERDLRGAGITREDIQEHDSRKMTFETHQAFKEKPKLRTGKT